MTDFPAKREKTNGFVLRYRETSVVRLMNIRFVFSEREKVFRWSSPSTPRYTPFSPEPENINLMYAEMKSTA